VTYWGSSEEERVDSYACDRVIRSPTVQVFRAVDVAAPASLVFRWLCQLRVAPYSYDSLDNLGRRSPPRLIDGLDQLAVGQQFMTIFRLVAFEDGHSITLAASTRLFGRVAVTYLVVPIEHDRSRIVVKAIVAVPSNLYGSFVGWILPPGDLLMMRKQLLRLRGFAERDFATATH
jgi:hypothetical protein